jgi:hypothetical protein
LCRESCFFHTKGVENWGGGVWGVCVGGWDQIEVALLLHLFVSLNDLLLKRLVFLAQVCAHCLLLWWCVEQAPCRCTFIYKLYIYIYIYTPHQLTNTQPPPPHPYTYIYVHKVHKYEIHTHVLLLLLLLFIINIQKCCLLGAGGWRTGQQHT